jgi:hypothetical protein
MEVLSLLQTLWSRRWLAAAGAVVALALGIVSLSHPAASSGLAITRVSLDTPESQLVTNSTKGMESLWWRATMFASLLGDDAERTRIAQQMNIPLDQLNVVDQELGFPQVPASLPKTAAIAGNGGAEPYKLTTHTDGVLPLIEISAEAPDRASATRLAQAAVNALHENVSPIDTPSLQGLEIEPVSTKSKTVAGASGKKMAAMVTLGLIVFWWGALALIPAIRAAWRNAVAQTQPAG